MISKELLSDVLGVKSIFRVMEYADNTGMNVQAKEFGRWQKLNIYELAHKCKKWAYDNGYMLESRVNYYDNEWFGVCSAVHNNLYFEKDTEPEAIFKACEWILQQGKQDE